MQPSCASSMFLLYTRDIREYFFIQLCIFFNTLHCDTAVGIIAEVKVKLN